MEKEGPVCINCGWNFFTHLDCEVVCIKCGAVNDDLKAEFEADMKQGFDMEVLTSSHYPVDKSKLVPMGSQHDQISENSKGILYDFHPFSGAKDFQGKRTTMFLKNPQVTGQHVGKGAKVEMGSMYYAKLECTHIKRSKKEVVKKQYVLCKKCTKYRRVISFEIKVEPLASKESKDDLFYRNCKTNVNDNCARLQLDQATRSFYGDVYDESYQTFVNILENLIPLQSLLSMSINYKGLAVHTSKELRKEYKEYVEKMKSLLLEPLHIAEELELEPLQAA